MKMKIMEWRNNQKSKSKSIQFADSIAIHFLLGAFAFYLLDVDLTNLE